ncbi:MAG: protoheme IX farnesyltransferase, partial [Halobacteriaceae archaeon]
MPFDIREITSTDRGLTELLVASAIGVYVLLIIGATTALLDSATACSTWPACEGELIVSITRPAAFAAWAHRFITGIVGVLLIVTAYVAHRREVSIGIRGAVAVTVLL